MKIIFNSSFSRQVQSMVTTQLPVFISKNHVSAIQNINTLKKTTSTASESKGCQANVIFFFGVTL